MDRGGFRSSEKRANQARQRRPKGLAVIERAGWLHIHGIVHAHGRKVSVRKGLGLQATAENRQRAEEERHRIETEIRSELKGEYVKGPALSIAAEEYLTQPRERPLGQTTIGYVQAVVRHFGPDRRLGDIRESEWSVWVKRRCAGVKTESRERLLNTVLGFLNWCARKPRRWGAAPTFDRDKKARNPRRRARRQVQDLSPELID